MFGIGSSTQLVRASRSTDMYAFAILTWELLTGLLPFHDCRNDTQLRQALERNVRPDVTAISKSSSSCASLPPTFHSTVEDLITKCWNSDRSQRKSSLECLILLQSIYQIISSRKYHIFISYSWKNQDFIVFIYYLLSKLGYCIWLDISSMGHALQDSMSEGIANSSAILVFLSTGYLESRNCLFELNEAYQQKKKVITVFLEPKEKLDCLITKEIRDCCSLDTCLYLNFEELYDDYRAFIKPSDLSSPSDSKSMHSDYEHFAQGKASQSFDLLFRILRNCGILPTVFRVVESDNDEKETETQSQSETLGVTTILQNHYEESITPIIPKEVTQEQVAIFATQEIKENYDLEVATTMLMSTVGGSVPTKGGQAQPNELVTLTKENLSQLDMIYITENLIGMAYPRERSKLQQGKKITSEEGGSEGNDINVVAAYLQKRHPGKFMIWNISEETYDYSKFQEQVLEYKFPGHPAPPLGLLFNICTSIESWLDADDENVAVIHCLTGKGRTATLMACVLTWLGEFDSVMQALTYVAHRRSTAVDYVTIPSQRRYLQYFSSLLDGVRPNSKPLLLREITINAIPGFGYMNSKDASMQGCCPYIQIFKNGKLISSAAAENENVHHQDTIDAQTSTANAMKLRWVTQIEGSATFKIDCIVQGDILIRCRHASLSVCLEHELVCFVLLSIQVMPREMF
jgi:serine/threonine protein kinase